MIRLKFAFFYVLVFVLFGVMAAGCNMPAFSLFASAMPTATSTLTPSLTLTASSTATPTHTSTAIFTPTNTPLPTDTPTSTLTPTVTATATPEGPYGHVIVAQGFCRYGPGKAYLYSHELNQGDPILVHGRNEFGTWLWVQPHDLDRHCWAAASLFEIVGDVMDANVVNTELPKSSFVRLPEGVVASRDGNEVTISWSHAYYIPVEDRRGYLIELWLCQGGAYFWTAFHTENNDLYVTDEPGCLLPSSALVYIAEKHGYSEPVQVPWP